MKSDSLKIVSFKIDKIDKIVSLLLLFCFAIFPLFKDFTWISTNIILPIIAILYFFSKEFFYNKLFGALIVIYLGSLFSIIHVQNFDAYFFELQKITGVFISSFIVFFFVRKNISNLFLVYYIFVLKFLIIIIFSYFNLDLLLFDFENERLSSGKDIGINANVYGYFCFLALNFCGYILIINKNLIYKYLFLILTILGITATILAASRGGLIFVILISLTISITLYWKEKRRIFLVLILLVLSISLLNKKITLTNFHIFERFENYTSTGEDERTVIVSEGLSIFLDNPLGVGGGQFQTYMLNSSKLNKLAVSHNSFLLLLVNYGLVSLIAYLYIFFILLKNSLILIKSKYVILKKYGFIFFFSVIYFFFYNFLYEMILDMYIFQFIILVYIHQKFLISNKLPILSNNK
jgi:O-antigen ligase